jgi:ABC-type branched-subunit amino acid transport system substrate-binding protein
VHGGAVILSRLLKNITLLFAFTIPIFSLVGKTIGEQNHLKVALVLGLTGHASYHADAIYKGVDLAADELRAKGWNIDLKVEDDQTNSTKAVTAFHSLLASKYRFFIGPTWSYQANAVRPILEKSDSLALVPAGSSDTNGGVSDSILNLCPPRSDQTPVLYEWLKSNHYNGGFVITPNGDWGEVHRKVYLDAMNQAKIEIIGAESFDIGADIGLMRALLLKVKIKKADLLLVTGPASDVANIVRVRNELKIPVSIVGTNNLLDAVAMGLLPYESIKNNVFVISLPIAKSFQKKFSTKFKESPKLYSERGYDALMILAEAFKSTDGSVENVRYYLKNNLRYSGASGVIEFSKEGNVMTGNYFISAASDFYDQL